MKSILKYLGFDEAKHKVRTELMAGLTTFLTMSYILAVNPLILGEAEWEKREAILRDMATQEQRGFALEGNAAAQAERSGSM